MDQYLKDVVGTVERMTAGRPAFVPQDFLAADEICDVLDEQPPGEWMYDEHLRRKGQATRKRAARFLRCRYQASKS